MAAPDRKRSSLWPALITVGLLLIVAGFVWQATSDASQWLEREDAEQYVEAAVKLHGQTMTPEADPDRPEPAGLVRAREAMAASVERIESARFKQRWLPRGLQVLGAILAMVGLIGQKSAAGR